jgi:mannosyltransferase OCH1-like enzyme
MDLLHLKVDFGRYVVLYLNGGMYVDMDAFAMRSVDSSPYVQKLEKEHASGKHVLGISTLNVNLIESYAISLDDVSMNNAILISSKQNPVLRAFIESIIHEFNKGRMYYSNINKIQNITGPTHFNLFFKRAYALAPKNHYIVIIPPTVFEPCAKNNCVISKSTVSIHAMDNTWFPSYLNRLTDMYFFVRPVLIIMLVLPVIIVFAFVLGRRSK